jgi:crossover junction endodeoxyribonuclease RuvC
MSKVLRKIMGIDPGSRVVGFAILQAKSACPRSPRDWTVIDAGVLKPQGTLPMVTRLKLIHQAVFELIAQHGCELFAIEKAFHGVNAATAIKLGEARGAIMAAAGRHNCEIVEFTPAEVKRYIGGGGRAKKEQLAGALEALIGFKRGHLPLDASDAVAIALSAGMSQKIT